MLNENYKTDLMNAMIKLSGYGIVDMAKQCPDELRTLIGYSNGKEELGEFHDTASLLISSKGHQFGVDQIKRIGESRHGNSPLYNLLSLGEQEITAPLKEYFRDEVILGKERPSLIARIHQENAGLDPRESYIKRDNPGLKFGESVVTYKDLFNALEELSHVGISIVAGRQPIDRFILMEYAKHQLAENPPKPSNDPNLRDFFTFVEQLGIDENNYNAAMFTLGNIGARYLNSGAFQSGEEVVAFPVFERAVQEIDSNPAVKLEYLNWRKGRIDNAFEAMSDIFSHLPEKLRAKNLEDAIDNCSIMGAASRPPVLIDPSKRR